MQWRGCRKKWSFSFLLSFCCWIICVHLYGLQLANCMGCPMWQRDPWCHGDRGCSKEQRQRRHLASNWFSIWMRLGWNRAGPDLETIWHPHCATVWLRLTLLEGTAKAPKMQVSATIQAKKSAPALLKWAHNWMLTIFLPLLLANINYVRKGQG